MVLTEKKRDAAAPLYLIIRELLVLFFSKTPNDCAEKRKQG